MTNWKKVEKSRNRYPEIGTKKVLRESAIEAWSKTVATNCGWLVRKFKTPSRRASPDDLFGKMNPATGDVRCFFVEFKAPGMIPSPAQLQEHQVMRDAGFTVYVCDSKESFMAIFVPEDQKILQADGLGQSNDPADWL